MAKSQVIIAASSQIAAEAGAAIANQGGNTVDAALAATIVSMCTELGVMAPGAGGFIAIWPPLEKPVVIDGYAEMPGRGLPLERLCQSPEEVGFDYGGWMNTRIGYRSVATPGIWAGLEMASQRAGRLPWKEVVAPSIYWLEKGFPLSAGAAEYLSYTHKAIFSWHPDSQRTIYHPDGNLLVAGEKVCLPQLAQTLRLLAQSGTKSFYSGNLGKKIAAEIQSHQGLLTADDLAAYRAIPRVPLCCDFGDWQVMTNPAPAIGGACVAAMLLLLERQPWKESEISAVRRLVEVQRSVLDYRREHLEGATHQALEKKVEQLLALAKGCEQYRARNSPSTIHISAVGSDGLACAVSASAGYGSGVMIEGTGLWLNNSLGEIELHPQGGKGLKPGARLVSNMAPTLARREDGSVLAIGSPGASRITTAIVQVLLNIIYRGMSLTEAVAYPRLHVEQFQGQPAVACEPGIPVELGSEWVMRRFPQLSMYFGGVQVASWSPQTGVSAAADFRRQGGIASSLNV